MLAALPFLLAVLVVQDPDPYPRIRLENHLPALDNRSDTHEPGYRAVRANAEDMLGLSMPMVEMSVVDPNRIMSASVVFSRVQIVEDGGRRGVWFARLRAARGRASTEVFADARTCPGVVASLEALNRLPDLNPKVPWLDLVTGTSNSAVQMDDIILDDIDYSVSLRASFDGSEHTDQITVSGGSYSPFAPIIVESLDRLKACWTETPPPAR
ncbi:MAG TPA: hypothetical protein VF686_08315 [Brevundimonas sp.]|jgi:hypothetical protein